MQNRTARLKELVEYAELNGVLLLAEEGNIIFHHASGYADRKNNMLLDGDSVFELASVSKPFTAIAVMILKEKGHLNFDDKVSDWLEEFPYEDVLIRNLLNHTSGLPEYMQLVMEQWDHKQIAENRDVLKLLIDYSPEVYFKPGEHWAYTNTNYMLLALIIEKASGKAFADYMNEAIFSTLEMNNTFVFNAKHSHGIKNYAFGHVYDPSSDGYVHSDNFSDLAYVKYMGGIQGDGAINSNAKDLLIFDQALYTEKLISYSTLKETMSKTVLTGEESVDYGLGWVIRESEETGMMVGHNGGWPGYSTCFCRFIDHNKTLIYLCNEETDTEFENRILQAATNILFDLPYIFSEKPIRKKAVEIELNECSKLEGMYQSPNQEELLAKVFIENGHLYLQLSGQVKVALHPLSVTKFFIKNTSIEINFSIQNEQVSHLYWEEDGETIVLNKI
ncbi:serine hydrolase domain-containing protein [Metabacillus fastidiosus]|uniref:serine hydrolase domain-containing protein n=1 Tax=Metabacillus fastidiosus TaxID=1458 RepID=UPI002E220B90|nr:serine hydrolase [Metabacillus fastidiosus]